MDNTIDSRTNGRIARFDVLVNELLPSLRTAHPAFTDEVLLESAVRIAARRLAGEEFVRGEAE